MKLANTKVTLYVNVIQDLDADTSYLEHPELADRKAKYQENEFTHCGIFVELEIHNLKTGIRKTYKSPGIWGIESDCGNQYAYEVAGDQLREIAGNCPEVCGLDIDEKKLTWKL